MVQGGSEVLGHAGLSITLVNWGKVGHAVVVRVRRSRIVGQKAAIGGVGGCEWQHYEYSASGFCKYKSAAIYRL